MNVPEEEHYVLAGYFRFVEDMGEGQVGVVVSKYADGFAEDSTVPLYRKHVPETKATMRR